MYWEQLKTSFLSLIVFSVLTGLAYPLGMTALAQKIFPVQSNGSLIVHNGTFVGSTLIGQPIDAPNYFWSRLSATGPVAYNGASSSGSNFGPMNPALIGEIQGRIDALHKVDPDNHTPIPIDLVTSSASGLDPHISPAAALYQVSRISRVRGIPESTLRDLIQKHTQGRFLRLLGEPAVNVLELNLDLDGYERTSRS